MKFNLVKSVVFENTWRYGVGLLACLFLISVTPKSGSAQVKSQKRVTSVQMGQASEGARVTVVSDSALSDYEAFRRGDRFYVKIPLADYTAAQPRFRGDGFENVQVQKFGDGVVVSFKLQAGASARVDQRSNRLDVIFSAANRTGRNSAANSESNRTSSGQVNNSAVTQGRDSAGPIPPGSPLASRERVVTERSNVSPTAPGQHVEINPLGDSNKVGNNQSSTSSSLSSSGSSSAVPGPSVSSDYQALTTGTPATPAVSKPAVTQSGSSASSNWMSRIKIRQWVSGNRAATLLSALLLLSVLVFFGVFLFRRRLSLMKAKRVKAPLAQPKYSPNVELKEVVAAGPASSAASETAGKFDKYKLRPVAKESGESAAPSFPLASVNASEPNGFHERPERETPVPEPALAQSFGAAASQSHAWVLHQPSIGPSPAGDKASSEDQEREVFEL